MIGEWMSSPVVLGELAARVGEPGIGQPLAELTTEGAAALRRCSRPSLHARALLRREPVLSLDRFDARLTLAGLLLASTVPVAATVILDGDVGLADECVPVAEEDEPVDP